MAVSCFMPAGLLRRANFSQHAVLKNGFYRNIPNFVVEILTCGIDLYVIGRMSGEQAVLHTFKQDALHGADKRFPVGAAHFLGYGDGYTASRLLYGIAVLPRHFVRGGFGTAGIGENVHFRKAALADKGKALGKFILRLPGECHDHVRGNGTAREPRPQQADAFIVPRGIILPPHSLQYRVAPGLHGQVELGTEVRKPGKPPAEILRHDSRFQTAQPHPQRRDGGADCLNQLRDRGLSRPPYQLESHPLIIPKRLLIGLTFCPIYLNFDLRYYF